MESKTKKFRSSAATALKDPKIQRILSSMDEKFNHERIVAASATSNWEEMRNKARIIKEHTLENLDYYLELVEANVVKAGGKVFFANTAEDATQYILNLAHSRGVKKVIKSKSMLSEEMSLNKHLASAGVDAVETDLGEYIIQLADETPYHIIAPAMHKSKEEVANLLHENLGIPKYEKIKDLAGAARQQLRQDFINADMGITGANYLVADTGTLALVTNEGNGRMCTSMPPIHVAIAGMERIIPSIEHLSMFLRLLIRSATGQRISSYVTTVTGPRRNDDEDGPEEFHLVIVDNGRSKILADPELRESLYCLRCGACLNTCPIYRKVGGHSYGWVYSGPIGAIISPMLTNLSDSKDLPYASSLCGACKEVCPVKINIPRMLLHLRSELTEGEKYPSEKNVSFAEKLAIKIWRIGVSNTFNLRLVNMFSRLFQIPFLSDGRIKNLPFPLSAWTKYRHFPAVASMSFHSRWRRYLGKNG